MLFQARYSALLELFLRHFKPRKITRAGLRYLNWLPGKRESGTSGQLHPCLKLNLQGLPEQFLLAQPLAIFPLARDPYRLTMQLVQDERKQGVAPSERSGVRLDIDCYREGPIEVKDALDILNNEHQVIDEFFFGIVNDDYLSYMKGDAR